jgi:intein/homing endonuclease
MLDVVELKKLIENGNTSAIAELVKKYGLTISDGKIIGTKDQANEAYAYWDKRQHVKKINLNAAYGALLANGCRFLDQRIGQSTTLTGRSIARHMASGVNQMITGEYSHTGIAVIYGDSVLGDTMITTQNGDYTIESLFQSGISFWNEGEKEYSLDPELLVLSYDVKTKLPFLGNINYLYRHKVSKNLYEIVDSNDNKVTVTEDHSVMIERNAVFMEMKPEDIQDTDHLISVVDNEIKFSPIKSVTLIRSAKDEYVYDIGMRDEKNHWFFGNNILVHNTDSVSMDTNIRTSMGDTTIESLFLQGETFWNEGDKEYSSNNQITIPHYSKDGVLIQSQYNYVYRHKVNKRKFNIETKNGKSVTVTEDHSVMVMKNGELFCKKPYELTSDDVIITVDKSTIQETVISNISDMGNFNDEYVYDIGVKNDEPYFFAGDILVHNSVYFSAYPVFKDEIERGELEWNKDKVIELYDAISDEVNTTFPDFMKRAFNVPQDQGKVIAAGREVVASKGLFITKKRYAALVFDKEGKRKDKGDSQGEMKAMGLDLKRADTPDYMQKFLEEVLLMVLTNQEESEIKEKIMKFRLDFRTKPAWEKGTPKRVNNLTEHTRVFQKTGKCGVGHALAAINWNRLRTAHGDQHSMEITDGMKAIVCKLKPNNMNMTSVAYPIDEKRLPSWFKELPFDNDLMEKTIIDKKMDNLLGVLKWELQSTELRNNFADLFEF